jgi:hypothetical protein
MIFSQKIPNSICSKNIFSTYPTKTEKNKKERNNPPHEEFIQQLPSQRRTALFGESIESRESKIVSSHKRQ